MEVPGIAPGSAKPSPSVSTCVFEDRVSPTARLLGGPSSASHCRLSPSRLFSPRHAAETSPNYRRSLRRLGRATQGTGSVSYAAKAKLSLAVVLFPGVSRGAGRPRHATSGSENASNLVHPPHCQSTLALRCEGHDGAPRRRETLKRLSRSVNRLRRHARPGRPLTSPAYRIYSKFLDSNEQPGPCEQS